MPSPEAEAVIARFEDVTMVGETVEQSGGHLGIAEDAGPLAEVQVGGDYDSGAFVQLANQVEQQSSIRRTESDQASTVMTVPARG